MTFCADDTDRDADLLDDADTSGDVDGDADGDAGPDADQTTDSDSEISPSCGDGVVQPELGEICEDNGSGTGIDDQYACVGCRWSGGFCGDGLVQGDHGEGCDDGLLGPEPDGCDGRCQHPSVTLPRCDPEDATVRIIETQEDLTEVNGEALVYCVTPGIYDTVTLTRSGTEDAPRYLIYHDPEAPESDEAPWAQTEDRRAVLNRIEVEAERWVIHGLTLRPGVENDQLLRFREGSGQVIADTMLIESGGSMVRFEDGEGNTLQNSVIREPPRVPGGDVSCILTYRATGVRIFHNEIYNCTDGIHVWEREGDEQYAPEGMVIAYNEIYITPELYADCDNLDPNTSLTPDGDCACAENAVDFKTGVRREPGDVQPEHIIRLSHNVMHGFRHTHSTCGGSGSGGPAVVIHHEESDFLLIEGNIVFNAQRGFHFSQNPDHVTLRNNVIHAVGNYDEEIDGTAISLTRGNYVEVYHNTVIGGEVVEYYLRVTEDGSVGPFDIRNNLFVSAGSYTLELDVGQVTTVGHNGFVNSEELAVGLDASTNVVLSTVDEAELDELCFTIHQHTSPETRCIPSVIPTAGSPLVDAGDPTVGSSVDFGVDDVTPVTHDFHGRPRDSAPDMGAFER